tara:strand:- start:428 stop:541 length:114 start_codon:yes stop_codon:yes gene_type:complete
MGGPYGQDEAFAATILLIGLVVLTVCWISEYFSEKDK